MKRVETVFMALVVVLALFALVSIFRNAAVSSEAQSLEERVSRAISAFRTIQDESDFDALQARLETLQSEPLPDTFPSRTEALALDAAFFAVAGDLGVEIASFDTIDGSFPVGDTQFLAVNYSMEAAGTQAAVAGLLQLLEDFPTALIDELSLTRNGDVWSLVLALAVVYEGEVPSGVSSDDDDEEDS